LQIVIAYQSRGVRPEVVKENLRIEVQVIGEQIASVAFKRNVATIRADHTMVRRSLACLSGIVYVYQPGLLCREIANKDIALPVVVTRDQVGSAALKYDVATIVAN